MRRKRNQTKSETSSPRQIEYEHDGVLWVVEDFNRLESLFDGVTPDCAPALHALGVQGRDAEWDRAWNITKWLCGIHPAVLPPGADATHVRPHSDQEVSAEFGLPRDNVIEPLALLQLAWQRLLGERSDDGGSTTDQAVITLDAQEPSASDSTFSDAQLALLRLGNFDTTIFDFHTRAFDRQAEINWFCERMADVRKAFDEPMAKDVAHLALLNVLQLRRINHKLAGMDPALKEYVKLQQTKDDIERRHGEQWAQLERLCPQAVHSSRLKEDIRLLSDLVELRRRWVSDPDNFKRDGVFTDDELQILMRTSQQIPDSQYRPGWVAAVNEAKVHLWDPKYKRRLTTQQCKLLDTGWRNAFRVLEERMKLQKPDLESDGADGEYPPIYRDADGTVTESEPLEEENASADESPVQIEG